MPGKKTARKAAKKIVKKRAKKVSKKTVKKVAKKVTKKVVKKTAKKVAKKTGERRAGKTPGAVVRSKKAPERRGMRRAPQAEISQGYAPGVGDRYSCTVCGLVVTVDESCGCIETCDIICCGEQMSEE